MTVKNFAYSRAEKLKSRKMLNSLFQDGKSLNAFPLKLIYQWSVPQQSNQLLVGVGVSSRNFKKAVDRNRIKRLLRESYRLQKQILEGIKLNEKQWQIFFMYTGKELPDTTVIQAKMKVLMIKLLEQCGSVC